jgi:CelD/BcsL family acetyltransferase involved in cellulose biosynthesis
MIPELVTDIESIEDLREEWSELLHSSSANNLFLTWEWISSWCTHMLKSTETPFIITARESNRLVGVAPLVREKHRFLGDYYHFIGQSYSYHLCFIALNGYEESIYKALWNYLFKIADKKYSKIGFTHMKHDFTLESSLSATSLENGLIVEKSILNPCVVLALPDSFVTYLQKGVSSDKLRENLRGYLNRLNRNHNLLYYESERADFDKNWLEMLRLHRAKMSMEYRHSVLQKQAFPDHLKDMASFFMDTNSTKLGILKIDEKTAAILFGIIYCGRFYAITIGIDPDMQKKYRWLNICVVSHSMSIKSAINNHCSEFDFLGGHQDFKYKMGGKERDGIRLSIFRSAFEKNLINSVNWFSVHLKNNFVIL